MKMDDIIFIILMIALLGVLFGGVSYLVGLGVVWVLHILFDTPYITVWWKRLLIGVIVSTVFGGGSYRVQRGE